VNFWNADLPQPKDLYPLPQTGTIFVIEAMRDTVGCMPAKMP
jgi:hypothetical protein